MKWRSVGESWGMLGFGGDGGDGGDGGGYDDCLIVDADAAAAVDGFGGEGDGDTWPAPERVADRCCRIEEEAQNDVNIDDQGDYDSADEKKKKEEEAAEERLSHSKADSVAVADSGDSDESVEDAVAAVVAVAAAAAAGDDDKSQTDLERPDHCATSAAAAVQPPCTTAWTPTCTADD